MASDDKNNLELEISRKKNVVSMDKNVETFHTNNTGLCDAKFPFRLHFTYTVAFLLLNFNQVKKHFEQ